MQLSKHTKWINEWLVGLKQHKIKVNLNVIWPWTEIIQKPNISDCELRKNNGKVQTEQSHIGYGNKQILTKLAAQRYLDMIMKPKRCGDRATLPHQCLTMRKLGENHPFQIWINSFWLQNVDSYTQQICFMWGKRDCILLSAWFINACRKETSQLMLSQTNTFRTLNVTRKFRNLFTLSFHILFI